MNCGKLGLLYEGGRGVPRDHGRATKLHAKACDGGWEAGCTNMGRMYEDGTGVARDLAADAKYYRRGCDGGNTAGHVIRGMPGS